MTRFNTQTTSFHPGSLPFGAVVLLSAFSLSASAIPAQPASKEPDDRKAQTARGIVVNIPDHKLTLLEDGRVVKIYDVAAGAHLSPNPGGEFQIAQRLMKPTYYKAGVVMGRGTDNPLVTRWRGSNIKGFGIHGPNRPASIGKNLSHGCIRLENSDVEDPFARICVGPVASRTTRVEASNQILPSPGYGEHTWKHCLESQDW